VRTGGRFGFVLGEEDGVLGQEDVLGEEDGVLGEGDGVLGLGWGGVHIGGWSWVPGTSKNTSPDFGLSPPLES